MPFDGAGGKPMRRRRRLFPALRVKMDGIQTRVRFRPAVMAATLQAWIAATPAPPESTVAAKEMPAPFLQTRNGQSHAVRLRCRKSRTRQGQAESFPQHNRRPGSAKATG